MIINIKKKKRSSIQDEASSLFALRLYCHIILFIFKYFKNLVKINYFYINMSVKNKKKYIIYINNSISINFIQKVLYIRNN